MDDLFGIQYNNLEPRKKLLTAVTNNMLDTLDVLLTAKEFDIDAPLILHNGDNAMHIACQKGYIGCVEKLLQHGANADATNVFGLTPLSCSLRDGNAECSKILLANGTLLSDPLLIWTSVQMSSLPTWLAYNAECLKVLINATPDLSWLDTDQLYKLSAKGKDLIRMYLLCGNSLTGDKLSYIISKTDDDNIKWIKTFKKCRTLQHYSRSEIRRNLKPNVLNGAKDLPIPSKIQEYLIIVDCSNPVA